MKRYVQAANYTAYGYAPPLLHSLVGFKGEYIGNLLELYFLGAGHRLYSPSLMKFISADVKSPFDQGGINAYAYCGGDPVNRIDPTGQSWLSPLKGLGNLLGLRRSPQRPRPNPAPITETAQMRRSVGEPETPLGGDELSPPGYSETFERFPESRRNKIETKQSKIEDLQISLDIAERMNDPGKYHYEQQLIKQWRKRDRLWSQPIESKLPSYDEIYGPQQTLPQTTVASIIRRVRLAD